MIELADYTGNRYRITRSSSVGYIDYCNPVHRERRHQALAIWAVGVLVFLYLPVALLVVYSFNAASMGVQWTGFTWRWYRLLAADSSLLIALEHSLIIASATTILATALGTAGAWLLHRYPLPRTGPPLRALILVPMLQPEVLMGVSLLLWFVFLRLPLGYVTVTIAHATFCFPFVLVAVRARLEGLDPSLEEAALDLGAKPWQAFWLVIVPFLRPAILSGALLSFTLSLDEYIVTVFTNGPSSQTLPQKIFGLAKVGLNPKLNALSTVFLLLTGALVLAGRFRPKTLSRLTVFALALLLTGGGSLQAAQLNLFCWSEYIPGPVIDSFQKETGVRVSVENYASNEEMLAKLLAGGGSYDLVQPSEYTVEALIKAGLLLPLDRAAITNFGNLDPAFLNQPFDPQNRFSIPWMGGTVGIVINTERVQAPVVGFGDLFSGKYQGRIVALDDSREMVSWALAYLHLPTNDITTQTLANVRPILTRWLPQIKVYDSDSPKTALLAGDVDLGVVWSGEGAILYRDHPQKFRWVLPQEGSHRFIDSLAIPKTCTHKAEAEQFMNYILRPEVSRQISDAFPYTNPNLAARKLLTPAQLANPASYPPAAAVTGLETFRDIGAMSSEVDALVSELKAAR